MKKIISLLIIFAVFAIMACHNGTKESLVSGTFEGSAESLLGELSVRVIIEKNKIEHIYILEYSDTPGYSDAVFDYLPAKIIAKNSTEVDVIAGATITSEALLKAVEDALKKAKRN